MTSAELFNEAELLLEISCLSSVRDKDFSATNESFFSALNIPMICGLQSCEDLYCTILKARYTNSLVECLDQWHTVQETGVFDSSNFSQVTRDANLSIDLRGFSKNKGLCVTEADQLVLMEEVQFREDVKQTNLRDLFHTFDTLVASFQFPDLNFSQKFLWYCFGVDALCRPFLLHTEASSDLKKHKLPSYNFSKSQWETFLYVVRCLLIYDTRVLKIRQCREVALPLFSFCSPSPSFQTKLPTKSFFDIDAHNWFGSIAEVEKLKNSNSSFQVSDKLAAVFNESSVHSQKVASTLEHLSILKQLHFLCLSIESDSRKRLELMSAALNILLNSKQNINRDIEEFIDLFGLHHLDSVETFIAHRDLCIQEFRDQIKEHLQRNVFSRESKNANASQDLTGWRLRVATSDPSTLYPIHKGKEFFMSSKEKKSIDDFLRQHTLFNILEALGYGRLGEKKNQAKESDVISDSLQTSLFPRNGLGFEKKCLLPIGAQHLKERGKEVVTFPPCKPQECHSVPLVSVKELPEWAQVPFQGIEFFNPVQSKVFPCVFGTNCNFLVSAPTSCGKTNIGLLAVLRSAMQYTHQSTEWIRPPPQQFKVVYIAPMKSLVSEICCKYTEALKSLGLGVVEMTSDTHVTREQLSSVHVIVTVPEKWDILTRQVSSGGIMENNLLVASVKCLILDEIHLLSDDRGPILESIVARTFRYMEMTQKAFRIVGLSATLPNWQDVGEFLHASPNNIFHFDQSFRPVPLQQIIVGLNPVAIALDSETAFNQCCYGYVMEELRQDGQVLIFVHTRDQTSKTANTLLQLASQIPENNSYFQVKSSPKYPLFESKLNRIRDPTLRSLIFNSIGFHHAGMSLSDRHLIERLFSEGVLRVLVSTSTLAWGVNLPARRVIIKGTKYFDSKVGVETNVHILDILQMFGRAGRPQYDHSGTAILITPYETFQWYLKLLMNQVCIESKLLDYLPNALNAEISMGNINNEQEALQWMSYTYLYIRLLKSPLSYGIRWNQFSSDASLNEFRRYIIDQVTHYLKEVHMIRIMGRNNSYYSTQLGRIAARYYIDCETAVQFDSLLRHSEKELSDSRILKGLAEAREFENIRVRPEEVEEIHLLVSDCEFVDKTTVESVSGKVMLLVEIYLKRIPLTCISLISDTFYIQQNMPRLARALLSLSLSKSMKQPGASSHRILEWCKMLERRLWFRSHVLRHFCYSDVFVIKKTRVDSFIIKARHLVKESIVTLLERRGFHIEELMEMSQGELLDVVRQRSEALKIFHCLKWIPNIIIQVRVKPITSRVVKIALTLSASFSWNTLINGDTEPFRVWVECPEIQSIIYTDEWNLSKMERHASTFMEFMLPLCQDASVSSQYLVHVTSDKWVGVAFQQEFSVKHLLKPQLLPLVTPLLNLHPLPVKCLNNPEYQRLYTFQYFNPIQTQIFHVLYHTDENVLLGAPTGSGKTIAAELAILRLCETAPHSVAVYIAPLKALARERVVDWTNRFKDVLKKDVIELTGDMTPDLTALRSSAIIVTTPEKFDGVTRLWKHRDYIRRVSLIILDEIHLLGLSRGPILEVIVSRLRYMSERLGQKIRFLGLSTALSNAQDIADWLDVNHKRGLFNFPPSVRPVPCEVHIQGFHEKHYCPRMASMNKPAYSAIQNFSPHKPVLIFVSSRRQTRLTAMDLIALALLERDSCETSFLDFIDRKHIENVLPLVQNSTLKYTLEFGVGLHHAGLHQSDRLISEKLFRENKIPILVTTSTLAWGVNLPAHLVIIKGTEIYHTKSKSYVDMPLTDVLQMMGRAGRPQYDKEAIVSLFVLESKKEFFRSFIYEPFPVESSLHTCLDDHLNAEIANATISSGVDLLNFLTWTYFFRRIVINPEYYLPDTFNSCVNQAKFTGPHESKGYLSGSRSDIKAINQTRLSQRQRVVLYIESLLLAAVGRLEQQRCIVIQSQNFQQDACFSQQLKRQDLQAASILTTQLYSITPLGKLASRFYVSTRTAFSFQSATEKDNGMTWIDILLLVANAVEYAELPVRHNEDKYNAELAQLCPIGVTTPFECPHTKTFLLFQSHLFAIPLPITDYVTDLKNVLDQSLRVLQCFTRIAILQCKASTTLHSILLTQSIVQGINPTSNSLCCLATFRQEIFFQAKNDTSRALKTLPHLLESNTEEQLKFLKMYTRNANKALDVLKQYPRLRVSIHLTQPDSLFLCQSSLYKESNHATVYLDWKEEALLHDTYDLKIVLSLWYLNTPEREVYTSAFSKRLLYGWWILVTDASDHLHFSRFIHQISSDPARPTRIHILLTGLTVNYERSFWKIFILSDTFMGLDQQIDFSVINKVERSLSEAEIQLSVANGLVFRNLTARPKAVNEELAKAGIDVRLIHGRIGSMQLEYSAIDGYIKMNIENASLLVSPHAIKTVGRMVAHSVKNFFTEACSSPKPVTTPVVVNRRIPVSLPCSPPYHEPLMDETPFCCFGYSNSSKKKNKDLTPSLPSKINHSLSRGQTILYADCPYCRREAMIDFARHKASE